MRNGVYATLDTLAGGMIEIDTIVPRGILCLYSAWHHYGMTTQIPDSYYVAIGRKRRVRLPEAIDITLIYQKDELLEIGRSKTNIEGFELSIYDRERCLCDAIKYRNKIGIDVMAEILNSYLSYPKKNLSLLPQYAKQLRVYNLLSTYLDVKNIMATNIAHSLKIRLLNLSDHDNRRYQQLLVRYMQERFLYRLSESKYCNNFILKGGALLYAYDEFLPRPTLDIDFMGNHISNDKDAIVAAFKEIQISPIVK